MICLRAPSGKLPARCVLFVLVAGYLPPESVADDPSLDEVIQRLNDWKDSFTNLRVVYEVRNPGQWLTRKPELAQPGDLDGYYRRYEFIYTDSGRIRLECHSYEAGRLVEREIHGNDGRLAYAAEFVGGDVNGTIPTELRLMRVPPSGRPALQEITPLTELWRARGDWLGKILQRADPILLGYDKIDGARCVGLHRAPDDVHTLWLDLKHDCLPRLQRPDEGVEGWSFHVEEFVKLDNGRWFPKRGTQTIGKDDPYDWEVTEAVVNEQISPARFNPPRRGPRTRVWDFTGPTPKLARSDRIPQADRSPTVTSPDPEGLIAAVLPNRYGLWIGLLIGAAAFLVTGIWLRKHS